MIESSQSSVRVRGFFKRSEDSALVMGISTGAGMLHREPHDDFKHEIVTSFFFDRLLW